MNFSKILYPTLAEVSFSNLRQNLDLLTLESIPFMPHFLGAVPMVKANAYGHGLMAISTYLEKHPTTKALGVATFDEAGQLRHEVTKKPVWIFSESSGLNPDLIRYYLQFDFTPVIHSLEDLTLWLKRSRGRNFQLKLNTGLNRLGLDPQDFAQAEALLRKYQVKDFGVFTHFAMSEDPSHSLTKAQDRVFLNALKDHFLKFNPRHIHSCNTGGILNQKNLQSSAYCNLIRPGIGLYGYGGKAGERLGLKPVLKWHVRILKQRTLKSGELVGYGATFRAKTKTKEAVLGCGYADGMLRSLSNRELLIFNSLKTGASKKIPVQVLGRVSMDLTSIKIPPQMQLAWVTILGGSVEQGEQMARSAGTLIYEILTRISGRVPRIASKDVKDAKLSRKHNRKSR